MPQSLESKLNSSAWKWCELFSFYLALPALIVADVVPLKYRWILFALTAVYILPILSALQPTWQDFGSKKENIPRAIFCSLLYVAGVTGIFFGLRYLGYFLDKSLASFAVLIIYPLVSAPIQEIFFRSYFFYRYKNLAIPPVLILLNILLFAFYHKIYGGWLVVLLSLIGGSVLTGLYARYKNYWMVWLVHGILGVLVYLAGLGGYFTDLI